MSIQSSRARQCLLGSLFVLAVAVSGCDLQQVVGVVTGLLGAGTVGGQGAPAPAGSPLAGPVIGSLPAAPAGPAAPGAAPVGGSPAAAGTVAARIVTAANELPDPFPYAPGTQNGNLGCADVVTTALENAGVMDRSEHQLAVVGTVNLLEGKGWTAVGGDQYKDGDVIVWDKLPGGNNMHIGIIQIENGVVYAINNSSSQRRVVKVPLSSMNRGINKVLRHPEVSA